MTTWKKVRLIILISIFTTIMICVLPIARKIDKTIPAFEWQNEHPDYQKQTQIKIKGIYKDYLFRKDTFKGNIEIDGYDYTYDGTHELLTFSFLDQDSHLQYMDKKTGYLKSLGSLYRNPKWDKTVICVFRHFSENNSSWSSDDGIIISAPATTREEAMKIATITKRYNKWFSRVELK